MVFPYYKKLSAAQKRIYLRSDAIHSVPLPGGAELHPLIPKLAVALDQEDQKLVEEVCRNIALGMQNRLGVPPLRVRVLTVRPSASWGELHGLYDAAQGRASAAITLWMRALSNTAPSSPSAPSCARSSTNTATTSTTNCIVFQTRSTPKVSTSANPACSINSFLSKKGCRPRNRVGGGVAPAVLPHHRTYGSVYGGSC